VTNMSLIAEPRRYWTRKALESHPRVRTSQAVRILVLLVCAFLSACTGSGNPTANSDVGITVQPTDQSVTEGQIAIFSVTANIYAAKYQWQVDTGAGFGDIAPSAGGVGGSDLYGPNGAVYHTTPATRAMDGSHYRVVVTGFSGDQVTSQAVQLTVTSSAVAPVIAVQPVSQQVTAPQPGSFSVVATGTPTLTYQWQQRSGDAQFADVSGAIGTTFTTAATTPGQSTEIRVVVSNAVGSVTSDVVTLSAESKSDNPNIVITTQPSDMSVTEGQVAYFQVIAHYTGDTATVVKVLSYTWEVDMGSGYLPIDPPTVDSQSSVYHPAATTLATSGNRYHVIVWYLDGTTKYQIISNEAHLMVLPAAPPLAITTQPTNQQVTAPQAATFFVEATGAVPVHYQWQKSSNSTTFSDIAGATSASYTTSATSNSDNGTSYRVIVGDTSGQLTSSVAALSVVAASSAPLITTQPADVSVNEGQAASFAVGATGVPAPTYQWRKRSSATSAFTDIAGQTNATLTLTTTAVADSGAQFVVVATNAVSTVTSNPATLTVQPLTGRRPLVGFQDVSTGNGITLALKNGVVWSWGGNQYGELGRAGGADIVPGHVQGLTGTFAKVYAKIHTSFAIRDDGSVWTWGDNGYGQLGNDSIPIGGAHATAVQVLQTDGTPLLGIIDLAMSASGSVVAWNNIGVAWSWGSTILIPNQQTAFVPDTNIRRALANDYFNGSTPKKSIKKIAIGGSLGLVVAKDDTASYYARLDYSYVTALQTLPSISGTVLDVATDGGIGYFVLQDHSVISYDGYATRALTVPFPVDQITTGEGISLVIVHDPTAGKWKAWGANDQGALGKGTLDARGVTVSPTDAAPILLVDDASKIAAGDSGITTVIALRPGGALWGWGWMNYLDGTGTGDTGTPYQLTGPLTGP